MNLSEFKASLVYTENVPGQSGLHSEALSLNKTKQKTKTKTNRNKKEKEKRKSLFFLLVGSQRRHLGSDSTITFLKALESGSKVPSRAFPALDAGPG